MVEEEHKGREAKRARGDKPRCQHADDFCTSFCAAVFSALLLSTVCDKGEEGARAQGGAQREEESKRQKE